MQNKWKENQAKRYILYWVETTFLSDNPRYWHPKSFQTSSPPVVRFHFTITPSQMDGASIDGTHIFKRIISEIILSYQDLSRPVCREMPSSPQSFSLVWDWWVFRRLWPLLIPSMSWKIQNKWTRAYFPRRLNSWNSFLHTK